MIADMGVMGEVRVHLKPRSDGETGSEEPSVRAYGEQGYFSLFKSEYFGGLWMMMLSFRGIFHCYGGVVFHNIVV